MNRRGVALLLAIAALATMGAISATWFALARTEAQIGRAMLAHAKARGAAEAALATALGGWRRELTPSIPGDSLLLDSEVFPGGVVGWAQVRALGGPIMALEATGAVGAAPGALRAQARIELLVRLDSAGADSLVRPHSVARGRRPIP